MFSFDVSAKASGSIFSLGQVLETLGEPLLAIVAVESPS